MKGVLDHLKESTLMVNVNDIEVASASSPDDLP